MSKSETELSKHLLKDMQHNVDIVKDGEKTFIYVGEALRKLRDDGLYKAKYGSFESLCKAEFQYAKSRAYQLIEASEVVNKLVPKVSTNGGKSIDQVVLNERQARALVDCADDDASRAKVMKALEKEGKPITAAAIKKKADEILPPKVKPSTNGHKPKAEKPKEPAKSVETEPEEGTSFDPSKLDGEKSEAAPGKATAKFEKLLTLAGTQIGLLKEGLGPLTRTMCIANDERKIGNFKALDAHYQRFHKEIEEAATTMIQFKKAWQFRPGK